MLRLFTIVFLTAVALTGEAYSQTCEQLLLRDDFVNPDFVEFEKANEQLGGQSVHYIKVKSRKGLGGRSALPVHHLESKNAFYIGFTGPHVYLIGKTMRYDGNLIARGTTEFATRFSEGVLIRLESATEDLGEAVDEYIKNFEGHIDRTSFSCLSGLCRALKELDLVDASMPKTLSTNRMMEFFLKQSFTGSKGSALKKDVILVGYNSIKEQTQKAKRGYFVEVPLHILTMPMDWLGLKILN